MASVSACLAVALLLCVSSAALGQKCDGVAPGAKLRYQWFYQLTSPTPANIKAMDAAVLKWMKEDCAGALAYGQGGTLAPSSATFGIAAPTATSQVADYGAWSDWASVDDIKMCYEKGLKSGNVQAIRAFSKKATRLVYDLKTNVGSTTLACPSATSYAPATVRFMFTYVLAKPGADTCKAAVTLQNKVASATGMYVRRADGCDVVADDSKVYAPTVTNSADYGGYIDFKSVEDMTKYLSNKSPAILADRTALRSMAATSMRVAIPLSAMAMTNAKPMGRRLM